MASSPTKLTGSPIGSPIPTKGSSQPSKLEEEEPSCTERCRSRQHGRQIWAIAFGGEGIDVICLWRKTCQNYSQVKDEFGRTALHAAATTGNLKAVEWLLKTQPCNINSKDNISGYTPLHRSIYFGHLHISRALIKVGADTNIRDNEGLTASELCQMDRLIPFKQNEGDLTELSLWGTNCNFNLGLGHQEPRVFPDVVPEFRRHELSLVKVKMNTYHSTFLTQSGKVFVSGYGRGGRLGTGDEDTVLTPTQIFLRKNGPCREIAVGQDHSIFLTDHKVWTVGSNAFGQLGHIANPPVEKLCTPRTLNSLMKSNISGIAAGNFHSIFYNTEAVFMCGKNQGQFGKGFEEQLVIPAPVELSLYLDSLGNGPITSVAGSDFCTVVCVAKKNILLLRNHKLSRIDMKKTEEVIKVEVTGDQYSSALFMLTGSGRVYVMRETSDKSSSTGYKTSLTKLVFSINRLLDVKDISLSMSSLLVINNTGEAYKAGWNSNNQPSIVGKPEDKCEQITATNFQVAAKAKRGKKKDDNDTSTPLELLKVKKIPNVHTAIAASSDVKGNNFAILQRHHLMDITDLPEATNSRSIQHDIATLYNEVHEDDQVCDLVFQLGSFTELPAHQYIVATASPVFARIFQFLKKESSDSEPILRVKVTNKLFSIDPENSASIEDKIVFKAVLDMIYTRRCTYQSNEWMEIVDGDQESLQWKSKAEFEEKLKEIKRFKSLLRILGMEKEERQLSQFSNEMEIFGKSKGEKIFQPVPSNMERYLANLPQIELKRPLGEGEEGEQTEAEYEDVILECSDHKRFKAHKCILVACLEYFRSLFSLNWAFSQIRSVSTGDKKMETVTLAFSSKAVGNLLEFIYENRVTRMKDADAEELCETLACADFTMTDVLLKICEVELSKNITMKNVVDVVQFAWKHNASQLKNTCFDFICLNLALVLETRLLDNLPSEMLNELSEYYKESQREKLSYNRRISRPKQVPEREEFEIALQQTPEDFLEYLKEIQDDECELLIKRTKQNKQTTKSRVRLRSRTLSEGEAIQENEEMADGTFAAREDEAFMAVNRKAKRRTSEEKQEFTLTPPPQKPSSSIGLAPERKLIVPLPMNKEVTAEKATVKLSGRKINDDFPKLGTTLTRSTSNEMASIVSGPGKTKCAPSSPSPSIPLANVGATNAWNRSNTIPTDAEKTVRFESGKMKVSTSNNMLFVTPSSVTSPPSAGGSKRNKTKWRTIKSDADILCSITPEKETVGPILTSDGRDRNNPWKTTKTPEKVDPVVFKAIVEDEAEKRRNFELAKSKPLPLMQIEDEMIEHIFRSYTSEDTLEHIELLSVSRVRNENYSTPVWVQQHPGSITLSSSSN